MTTKLVTLVLRYELRIFHARPYGRLERGQVCIMVKLNDDTHDKGWVWKKHIIRADDDHTQIYIQCCRYRQHRQRSTGTKEWHCDMEILFDTKQRETARISRRGSSDWRWRL